MNALVKAMRRRPVPLEKADDPAAAAAHAARTAVRRLRAIFLSDIHLGTPGCKAAHLIDFLRHHEAQHLYLIGDVIDGWALRRRFYWPQTHNDVVQKVLRCARKGTRVTFVPGNHDEVGRQFTGLNFGDIAIRAEAEHQLLDGRSLWVVHGDFADGVIQHARWLALMGDRLYDFILWLNRHFNTLRAWLGHDYWSLSQWLKHKTKNAVSFITHFEQVLLREARRRGYDGVVCGHIHKAEIRTMEGLLYCNDGDWVESLTALVETLEGQLEIVEWKVIRAPAQRTPRWDHDDEPASAGHELAA
jgi:UDP-2,3-diacylglucosamine pyrophosphatase LpxH